jgi:HEPN domain-containing protein
MQPEAESAGRWLTCAESDLEAAGLEPRGKLLRETLCFHAQQATEKAIKPPRSSSRL